MRPLEGIRVLEMAGAPTASHCGMFLSDFGAQVLVMDRLSKHNRLPPFRGSKVPFDRGKQTIRVDIKTEPGKEILRRTLCEYDVLIEPYRPGVMERLGFGPEEALRMNPRLVYARLTGWGQDGAFSQMPGHDINYISIAGVLSLFRRKGEKPTPPANMLGDFAGGSLFCALGVLLALLERTRSGKGQVIDASIVDGVAHLSTVFYGLLATRRMTLDIGTNMLDGGSHFYQVYETKDKKFMAVGAVEEKFYAQFVEGLGLDPSSLPPQRDTSSWPALKERCEKIFKTKTRDEWSSLFEKREACVTPVIEFDEFGDYPNNKGRKSLVMLNETLQPAPAPRLSRTPGQIVNREVPSDTDSKDFLKSIGFFEEDINELRKSGTIE
jgi:alpha-methylacyl-CoA racemase